MASILNAIIADYVEAGRIMLKLSSPDAPFDVQFEQGGKKYAIVVREIPSKEERTEVDAEVVSSD